MATYNNLNSLFKDIANSIRSKSGSSAAIVANNFPNAINALDIGTNTSTANATAADILAPKVAFGNSSKLVGTIPTRNASDLTVNNNQIITKAGYYATDVSKNVAYSTFNSDDITGEPYLETTGDYGFKAVVNFPKGYYDGAPVTHYFSTNIFPAPESKGTADKMRLGYSLYDDNGVLITGTMPTVTPVVVQGTASGATVTGSVNINAGYTEGFNKTITGTVSTGNYFAAQVAAVSVTPKTEGTITSIATNVKPSGTDGTNYYTINPNASYSNGNARAAVDGNGYVTVGNKYVNTTATVGAGEDLYINKGSSTVSGTIYTGTTTLTVNNSNGYVTAPSVSKATSVTPSVTAGYIATGTAGSITANFNVSGKQLPVKSGDGSNYQNNLTVTPSSSDQTIMNRGEFLVANHIVVKGSAATITTGSTATGSSFTPTLTYNSTSTKFDYGGSNKVEFTGNFDITKAGYVSGSDNKQVTNNNAVSATGSLSRVTATATLSATGTNKPVINRVAITNTSTLLDGANGAATITAPTSKVWIRVNSGAATRTVTANISSVTAGYSDGSHYVASNSAAGTFGAAASDATYVEVKPGAIDSPSGTGASTIGSVNFAYNSTAGAYDLTGSNDITGSAYRNIGTSGWLNKDNTAGTVTGTASLVNTVPKASATTTISGTIQRTPVIAISALTNDTVNGFYNVANGTIARTTKPENGFYIGVASPKNTATANTSLTLGAGYTDGTAANTTLSITGKAGGAAASAATYVGVDHGTLDETVTISGSNFTPTLTWNATQNKYVYGGSNTVTATGTGTINTSGYMLAGENNVATDSKTIYATGTLAKAVLSVPTNYSAIDRAKFVYNVNVAVSAGYTPGDSVWVNGEKTLDDATFVSKSTATVSNFTPTLTWNATSSKFDYGGNGTATFNGRANILTAGYIEAINLWVNNSNKVYATGNLNPVAITNDTNTSNVKVTNSANKVTFNIRVVGSTGYSNGTSNFWVNGSGNVPAGALTASGSLNDASVTASVGAYNSTAGTYPIAGSGTVSGTAYANVSTAGYVSSTNNTSAAISSTATAAGSVPKAGVTANILNATGKAVTTSRAPVLRYGGVPSGTINAAGGAISTTAPTSGPYITVNSPANSDTAYAYISSLTAGYTDGTAANTTVAYNSKACGAAAMANRYIPIKVGDIEVTTVTNTIQNAIPVNNIQYVSSPSKSFLLSGSGVATANTIVNVVNEGYVTNNINNNFTSDINISALGTLSAVTLVTSINGNTLKTPVINKVAITNTTTLLDAASGAATKTAPTSGVYVRVNSQKTSETAAVEIPLCAPGYFDGTLDHASITLGNKEAGAAASGDYYVPITIGAKKVTQGTASGATVTGYVEINKAGWMNTENISVSGTVAGGTLSGTLANHETNMAIAIVSHSGNIANIGVTQQPSGTAGTDYYIIGFTDNSTGGTSNVRPTAGVTKAGYVTTANNSTGAWSNQFVGVAVTKPTNYFINAATVNAPSGSKAQSKPSWSFNKTTGVVTASVAATSGTAYANITRNGYYSGTTKSGTFTMSANSNTYNVYAQGIVTYDSTNQSLDMPAALIVVS